MWISSCSKCRREMQEGRGTSRNDMGAFGGPWVCDWTDPSSKPKIRIEPITDVVLDGEPAAMDVLATGDKVLSYQWYRSEDEALTLHPILGATNAVLSWSAAQVSDDSFIARTTNLFYVEVSNEAGRVISSPASLIVTPLEVSATFKAGKVELTIRRNKPIAKCEIHTAKDLKDFVPSPATVVATVDLTESLTTWRDPIPPRSTNQFYRALPVQ